MVIGSLELELFISHAQSLKEKRSVVRRIVDRVRNKFNVSVAEVDCLDLHQRAVIGVVAVSNDQKFTNSVLNQVHRFVEGLFLAEVIGVQMMFY